ncbi:cupredoxin family copper-binding protein [Burkholderia sp. 4M9327F10]|jgi:plastocyanin
MLLAASAGFSVAQAQETNAVTIKNFMFSPMAITVKAGTTVTWKNLDGEPHTVVNDAGLFRSAALDQNETFQYKFDKPGVYKIFCGIHPNMRATVTVQ